ncbi:MAG: hypothetical protein IK990_06915, partial [Ruminiclostridium sp.]|nr:hypothetical protein [Ruminiclostridium sp.]
MDISSRRKLSKAMAALVFASAVTGAAMGNVKASAYDGNSEEGVNQDQDLGTSVKSILGEAANYNVFIKDNYTQNGFNNVDAGNGSGVLAVGGNFNVGAGYSQACSSATVGGDVTGTIIGNYINGGIDFDSAFESLNNTSNYLATLEGGTVEDGSIYNDYGRIKFVGNNETVNVFNITVDEWNSLKGASAGLEAGHNCAIDYVVPKGSTVIVNIVGSDAVDLVFNWGGYYASNTPLTSGNSEANSKVLINIPGGNNVVINSGVGCVLAPSSHVTSGGVCYGGSPHYEGQVVAESFTGNIEFGASLFDGENPDVTNLINTPTDEDDTDDEKEEETEETTSAEDTETPEESETPEETDEPEETTAVSETETPEETTEATSYTSEVSVDADTPIDYVSTTTTAEVTTIADETTAPEETSTEDTTTPEETSASETETPEETTAATEAETPEETTAATEAETPEETTAATEAETPEETTAATEAETPEETTAATEAETPEETTAATEAETPEETTAATEAETPEETTAATEAETPEETTAATEETVPDITTNADGLEVVPVVTTGHPTGPIVTSPEETDPIGDDLVETTAATEAETPEETTAATEAET